MNRARIDAIAKKVKNVSCCPWTVVIEPVSGGYRIVVNPEGKDIEQSNDDALFILDARQNIIDLLDKLRILKEQTKMVCACGKSLAEEMISISETLLCRECMLKTRKQPWCCQLYCEEVATWEIYHGDGPEDNTMSCDHHISDLLTDARRHTIVSLREPAIEGG